MGPSYSHSTPASRLSSCCFGDLTRLVATVAHDDQWHYYCRVCRRYGTDQAVLVGWQPARRCHRWSKGKSRKGRPCCKEGHPDANACRSGASPLLATRICEKQRYPAGLDVAIDRGTSGQFLLPSSLCLDQIGVVGQWLETLSVAILLRLSHDTALIPVRALAPPTPYTKISPTWELHSSAP